MGSDNENFGHLQRRLMLRLLGSAGFAGKLLGAPKDLQYRRLREPIVIPLTRVAKSWTPFTFQAVADKLGPDGQSGPGLLLPGVLLRVGTPAGDDSGLRAFCLSCPHELCDVVLKQDTGLVPLPEGAKKQEHPLFVCPCHFSVFDPVANGAHLTGPAGQALFRFRLRVSSSRVEIDAVEKDALR